MLKKILLITVSLLAIYGIFIFIEVQRFNNNLGVKPIILLDEEKICVTCESGSVDKEYIGLGYTFEYEYFVKDRKDSDHQEIIILSGEFKLFDKILISAWII